MKRTILIILCVFVCSAALMAANQVVHVVKKGDTLWGISRAYLNTPFKWPLLWSRNKEITNPHLIYPGDKVIIRWSGNNIEVKVIPKNKLRKVKIIKLAKTPGYMNRVLVSPEYSGIIYVDKPLSGQGTVLKKEDGLGEFAMLGDSVSIRVRPNFHPRERFTIASKEAVVKSGRIRYGYVYRIAALAMPVSKVGNVLDARIVYSAKEVTKGDLLLEDMSLKALALDVSRPKESILGHVEGVYGDPVEIGPLDVVFIDLGKNQGLKDGSILGLYKNDSLVKPGSGSVCEGKLLVLKALDRSSMALVVESKVPLARNVLVGNIE